MQPTILPPLAAYTWGEDCSAQPIIDQSNLSIKRERMPKGSAEEWHFHQKAEQYFFIQVGSARFECIGATAIEVKAGQTIHLPQGCIHRILALEAVEFMVISQPNTENDRINVASIRSAFELWSSSHRTQFAPLIDFSGHSLTQLDLSTTGFDHQGIDIFEDHLAFNQLIDSLLKKSQASIGVGGYGERRNLYQSSQYSARENHRRRNTHLGFDIWGPVGTTVYAPWEGTVHSFKYDPEIGSYGATIILEHHLPSGSPFYTLYGHLSKASLTGLVVGQAISTGQILATLGDHTENGCWPPHLHFQVMLHDLGLFGDFPGVAYEDESDAWLLLCPNPEVMVNFSFTR